MFLKVTQKVYSRSISSPKAPEFKPILIPVTDIEKVEASKHEGCSIYFKTGKESIEVLESIACLENRLNMPKYSYLIGENAQSTPRQVSDFSTSEPDLVDWQPGEISRNIKMHEDFHFVNYMDPHVARYWLSKIDGNIELKTDEFIILDVSGADPDKCFGYFKSILALVFDGRYSMYQSLRR